MLSRFAAFAPRCDGLEERRDEALDFGWADAWRAHGLVGGGWLVSGESFERLVIEDSVWGQIFAFGDLGAEVAQQ